MLLGAPLAMSRLFVKYSFEPPRLSRAQVRNPHLAGASLRKSVNASAHGTTFQIAGTVWLYALKVPYLAFQLRWRHQAVSRIRQQVGN